KIQTVIKRGDVTTGEEVRIRRELESFGREIKVKYSYTDMKGFIRNDFRQA
ncbi:MAG: hypothetical protein HQL28_02440, partial [Candidatus Omnitrophica bacterium]|nr:hypothetical protein [Candidatus Omnitrophota bacterium]